MNINGAFSEQLIECAGKDSRIMVVDPEVARSTKMREFGQAYPDRFFEVGVAKRRGNFRRPRLLRLSSLFCILFSFCHDASL